MNVEEVRLSKDEMKEKIRRRYEGVDSSLLEVIPAKEKPKLDDPDIERRVAVYVRVSTDDPRQTSSFELQKNHYSFDEIISRNPSYKLVGIYEDEGISGTSIAKRKQFNKMIDDCRAGKIDLIITKSLSRFARNLVDTVLTIRELAQMNPPVGVLFETENIYTLDKDKEMILNILAMLAQEESHIKSDIMNASLVWRFSRGIFLTPVLLGYDHDSEKNLVVNEIEAKTVRLIFFMYLYGHSCKEIADVLTDIGRKTKKGNIKWSEGSICNILRNERYCGDVLSWKTHTVDYISHKKQKNVGDKIQHRQRNHHEPIIRRDDFIAVQHMLENAKYGNKSIMPELEVIREGSLKGFISVNPRWCSFKTDEYIAACTDADEEKQQEDILIEADPGTFDFRGFEVARSQFFDTTNKMCVTFDSKGVQFSTTCVKKFQDNQYIEILVHPIKKLIVVRNSNKKVRNSMRWAKIDSLGNTVARKISGSAFMPTLYELFEWNIDFKYRIRGVKKQKDNTNLIIFDIKDATVFVPQPVTEEKNNCENPLDNVTPVVPKNGKSIVAFPSAWANNFGNDFYNQTHITPLKIAEKNGVDAEAIPFGESELEITAPDVVADNIQMLMKDMKQEDLINGNNSTYNG